MIDLYTQLGVDRTATSAQIKAAYRKLAKKAHPDAGGDRRVWDRILHAYEVLSDAPRRAKYDATGDDTQTPDPEDLERAQVAAIVREIISGVLQSSRDDPARIDFRERIISQLDVKRAAMTQDKHQLELKVKRVERFVGRFVKEGSEDDIIGDVVKQGLRDLETQIANVERAMKLHEKVVAVFLQYRYEMDPTDSEGQNPPAGPSHQRYLFGGQVQR